MTVKIESSEPDWVLVVAFINKTLKDATGLLNGINQEAVRHYVFYSEYEMAFEVLFLEIMKFPKIDFFDCDKALEFASLLKLNTDTVYDDCFFDKLVDYCTTDK